MTLPPDIDSPALSPDDARVLDLLAEHGLDDAALERLPVADRARGAALLHLFGLLESYPVADASDDLVRRTLERVASAEGEAAAGGTHREPTLTLCAADGRVFDLLAEQGFDATAVERLPAADRSRGTALVGALSLLDSYPVSDADDSLVDATLARIARHDAEQRAALRLVGADEAVRAGGRRSRFAPRWSDLLTLAAVVLLGTSVLSLVIGSVRTKSQQAGCSSNLARLGGAFSAYANDHAGLLPSLGAAPSWELCRNADNLDLLARNGYCQSGHLSCPGHSGSGPAYGFRLSAHPAALRMDLVPTLALMSDRNPAVDQARAGLPVRGFHEPSANHAGRGQHILFGDGSVIWTVTPLIAAPAGPAAPESGPMDNIWLMTIEGRFEDLRKGAAPVRLEQFVTQ